MLRLNNMKPRPGSTKSRKRLGRGRGTGQGGTAGKGHKGQLSRSGGTSRPGFEGGQTPLYRRLPKFGFKSLNRDVTAEFNVSDLERIGMTEVSLTALREAGFVKGRADRLAVLGNGELKKSVKVLAHKVSKTAAEKIQKAGGSVEIVQYASIKKKADKKSNAVQQAD